MFLNACESGRGGRADFNKGVAQSLVAHGLPALVANQYSVLDSSATSFAQHFYWSLAQGMSIGQAAREARIAVNYSLHGRAHRLGRARALRARSEHDAVRRARRARRAASRTR